MTDELNRERLKHNPNRIRALMGAYGTVSNERDAARQAYSDEEFERQLAEDRASHFEGERDQATGERDHARIERDTAQADYTNLENAAVDAIADVEGEKLVVEQERDTAQAEATGLELDNMQLEDDLDDAVVQAGEAIREYAGAEHGRQQAEQERQQAEQVRDQAVGERDIARGALAVHGNGTVTIGKVAASVFALGTLVGSYFLLTSGCDDDSYRGVIFENEAARAEFNGLVDDLEGDLNAERRTRGSIREDGSLRTVALDSLYLGALKRLADRMTTRTPNMVTRAEAESFRDAYGMVKQYLADGNKIKGFDNISDILDKAYDGLERLFDEPPVHTRPAAAPAPKGPSKGPMAWKAHDNKSRERNGAYVMNRKGHFRRTQHRPS
jgi:hypothetical protein